MFSHSSQWIWSAQILESNSHPEWMFSHSGQWTWSAQTLTSWMGVQQFWSVNLICWRETHILDRHSILVSGSDLLKHTIATHKLDGHSAILVSVSDLLKQWRVTHILDECSFILVSGSDLPKHWRVTHKLNGWSIKFSSVILICLTYILVAFPISLVRKIHIHFLQSYLFSLHNLSGFNHLLQEMQHTYCQHFLSLIFNHLTWYYTHILNHLSIRWHVKIIINFTWPLFFLASADILLKQILIYDDFQRWRALTNWELALTGIYLVKSEYPVQ